MNAHYTRSATEVFADGLERVTNIVFDASSQLKFGYDVGKSAVKEAPHADMPLAVADYIRDGGIQPKARTEGKLSPSFVQVGITVGALVQHHVMKGREHYV